MNNGEIMLNMLRSELPIVVPIEGAKLYDCSVGLVNFAELPIIYQ
jgi:hypothetical protein